MSKAPKLGAIGAVADTSLGFRNRIINGRMDIAQRGASFAAVATGTYTLDRFQWQQSGSGVGAITQQADAPTSNELQSSLRYTVNTADASIAATDLYYIRHAIEGYNVRDLIGRAFTLSFLVRSSKTGVHCVAMQNSGGDRSLVSEYVIGAANTWERKSIVVPAGLITAGAWNWTDGVGLMLGWVLAAGSNYQGTKDAWQSSAIIATSNQVNCLDTVGNIFAITGVQLEAGAVALPFEHRSIGNELALCQRYYYAMPGGSYGFPCPNSGGFAFNQMYPFKQTMRAAPTVTPNHTSTSNLASINPQSTTTDFYSSQYVGSSASNATWQFSMTASAEL